MGFLLSSQEMGQGLPYSSGTCTENMSMSYDLW